MPLVDSRPDGRTRAEDSAEARGAALRKELGLTDLVLTQILFIVGLPWVGVAAEARAARTSSSGWSRSRSSICRPPRSSST